MSLKNKNLLYEINTAAYLNRLSRKYERTVSLAEIPDEEIQNLVDKGVGTVWLMGVWERSMAAIEIVRHDAKQQAEFTQALPDVQDEDVIGSAYSISDYRVSQALGGNDGLKNFRERLRERGIGLILDFVPNHTAPDHSWSQTNPEYYITGSAEELAHDPLSYLESSGTVFAKGRDPEYPAWSDVIQLNAFASEYRQRAIATLQSIAELCDGVRCDMAMLMMTDIFERTWGERAGAKPATEFWEEVIPSVRNTKPDFIFLAETYWDTELDLVLQGFDYCYDKILYDILLENGAEAVMEHLQESSPYREHLANFIENHDEQPAAAVYEPDREKAAAAIVATLPGLWLFHDGQAEGFKTKLPVHLGRGPIENADTNLQEFYTHLFSIINKLSLSESTWRLVKSDSVNWVTYEWTGADCRNIVIINYSPEQTRAAVYPAEYTSEITEFTDEMTGDQFSLTKVSVDEDKLECDMNPWQIRLLVQN